MGGKKLSAVLHGLQASAGNSSVAAGKAKVIFVGIFGLSSLLAVSSVWAAPPTNLITNGDFETGDFAGWESLAVGSALGFQINDGTYVHPAGIAIEPISGDYDAVSGQTGPGQNTLRQLVTVPTGVFSAKLAWSDRIRNLASIFSDPNQEWRIVLRDVFGNVIQEVYSTTPGDPLIQLGPNARSGNVTAALQANEGEDVYVSFEQQDNLNFFNATLDDAVLLVSVLPTDKDECKKGGWTTFIDVNDNERPIFKNQGDCVSFVATKGKNPPANY
jgi:hypothetical protein